MRYANLNGHDHTYERFAPQTPSGELDGGGGLHQFIVANGGKSRSACHRRAHREVANAKHLRGAAATASSYEMAFVPEVGRRFIDSGSTRCH